MADSIYTLLIVESPVLAERIQRLCPSSIYVLSTDGYCWNPVYDAEKNELKAIADPEKVELRKEIKEQASWANNIIIATDSDPSGDFITWSLAKFLNMSGIKRGKIQSLSRNGVLNMIHDVSELQHPSLEERLKNRYLIQHEWAQSNLPPFQLSGLTAVFGAIKTHNSFRDKNGYLYYSSKPMKSASEEWISVHPSDGKNEYRIYKPLSTFDVIAMIIESELASSYSDAQSLLQELFQARMPFSDHSLISYPRTRANAFYSETWENFRNQYVQFSSQSDLKPRFLQDVADPESPHESIHPLSLTLKPTEVTKELPKRLTRLYKLIYKTTLKSIKLPEPASKTWKNHLNPDIYFYPDEEIDKEPSSLRPNMRPNQLGDALSKLGVLRPSNFGSFLDKCIYKKWITIKNNDVEPGKAVRVNLTESESLLKKLTSLKKLADDSSLKPETVRSIISS